MFDTSADSGTNERIFYSVKKVFQNESNFYSINNNSTKNKINITYEEVSFFANINYENYFLSFSNNGYLEVFDFKSNYVYSIETKLFFGYENISSIGPVLEFTTYYSNDPYQYIFSFIAKYEKENRFILAKYSFNQNILSENMTEGFYLLNTNYHYSSKSKMISCYIQKGQEEKAICLYRDDNNILKIIVYNSYLKDPIITEIDNTGNKEEDNDIFFKGIYFEEEIGVFFYYKNFDGSNPIFSMKRFVNESIWNNYSNFGLIEVEANDFNRHYKLNDLVKLNNDIYYASTSKDREKLYFVVFSIVNETQLDINYYSIKTYELYQFKFYKEIKLAVYESYESENLFLGFSHCNNKKCEDDSLHFTSLLTFNEEKNNYDLLQDLYKSNTNIDNGVLIEFNQYKNSLFARQVEYIKFFYIEQSISLISPVDNKLAIINEMYNYTSFYLQFPLNHTGYFYVEYCLYISQNKTNNNNQYIYNTKTIYGNENRRRNLLRNLEEKFSFIAIKINNRLSNSCGELCSLCTDDSNKCITCKFGFTFIGEEKYCFDENGKIDIKEIRELYDGLKNSIENQESQVILKDNAIFQISTVEEQKNNQIPFISSVDLGECEQLLKGQEGLDNDEDFVMLKMDLKNENSTATFVQYEIFNPNTLDIVSLDVCTDIPINLYIPVILNNGTEKLYEKLSQYGYQLFNINDSFYNDICSKFTAENGADMILSNRKKIIYDNNKNIPLCQEGCSFVNYSSETKKAKCNCEVQKKQTITDITKINFDANEFTDSFYKVLKNSNFLVMKCFKLVFSSQGQKKNFGSYMMSTIIVLFIAMTIIYLANGQKKIKEIIDSILENKKSGENKIDEKIVNNKKEKKIKEKIEKDKKNDKRKDYKRKSSKKKSIKTDKKKDNNPPRKKSVKKKSTRKQANLEEPSKNTINSVEHLEPQSNKKDMKRRKSNIAKIKDDNNLIEEKNNKIKKNEKKKHNEKEDINKEQPIEDKDINIFTSKKLTKGENVDITNQAIDLNDEEMNTLEYEKAIIIDKRSYFQYYYSLLKKKHLILFIFLPNNDYNLIPIKFILFLISFSMYMTVNAFFFSDDSMNKIYTDNGEFNFLYQLPQIFYSTIVSVVINMILKKLSLSEKQVISLKQEKDLNICEKKAKSIQKCLKIRLIIFLFLTTILILFFWYFISCFCAVYENTQMILIKDTLVSFALSMAYPFGLNLLPGFLRIPALRSPKADKKCLYTISTYVALI